MDMPPASGKTPVSSFISLLTDGVMLCVVAVLAQPLVYAHANGYSIIGANLGVSHSRSSSLKVAHHWLASLGVVASVVPFLVGEYSGGSRVAVAPYPHAVPRDIVARTPAQRKRLLASGPTFIWCTLAALAGTVSQPSLARSPGPPSEQPA
eukprot:6186966-Pleurochrysis_carterae.AAC.4